MTNHTWPAEPARSQPGDRAKRYLNNKRPKPRGCCLRAVNKSSYVIQSTKLRVRLMDFQLEMTDSQAVGIDIGIESES